MEECAVLWSSISSRAVFRSSSQDANCELRAASCAPLRMGVATVAVWIQVKGRKPGRKLAKSALPEPEIAVLVQLILMGLMYEDNLQSSS